MPHIIIEYPHELASAAQIEAMLDTVHLAVVHTNLFEVSHIKLRAIPLHYYRNGGVHRPFLHGHLRIHAGRSSEQKQLLSNAVLAALRAQPWAEGVITVEVVEMDRESYAKFTH